MSNKITIKRSSVPAKVPAAADLDYGEIAINYADGNLFFKNSSNVVTTIASTQFTSVTGNVTAGNILTGGLISATGNITGGNIRTAGQISATGTITSAGGTNGTAFAVGNSAVSNVALGFFPTTGTRGDYAIRDYSDVASTMYFDVGMGGTAAGTFQFRTTNSYSLLMQANTAGITTPGRVYGLELNSTQSSGDEGGQINLALAATNTTLVGNVIIDVYQNKIRFFEGAGTNRGAYIDLTAAGAGVSTNLLATSGGTPGGSNTYVQFNDAGSFGGNSQFTYNKVTNTLLVGNLNTTSNGLGTNILVGDDAWIGDINAADTMGIKGAQSNGANGYVVFGNADGIALGRAGTGPLTYGGAFSAAGNIISGNLITAGLVTATGNITSGNLITAGLVTATGNVRGGNLTTDGNVVATGNVSGGNVAASTTVYSFGNVTGVGNVSGGNLLTAGLISATGNLTAGNVSATSIAGTLSTASQTNITAVGTLTSLNSGAISSSGNITGANILTGGLVSATGNITGGNLTTSGLVSSGTLTTTGNATIGGDLIVNGNVTYINVTEIDIKDPIIALGRGANNTPLVADDGKDRGEQLWYFNTTEKSAFIGWNDTSKKLFAATDTSVANNIVTVNSYGSFVVGALEGTTVSVTGTITGANVTGANLLTSGLVSATGNVTSGNILTGGLISATGNLTAGNLSGTSISGTLTTASQTNITAVGTLTSLNSGAISSSGNITGANILTSGLISATGNITAGNVLGGANVNATTFTGSTASLSGNVTSGNILTGGIVSATGNISGNYFIGNGSQLTGINTQGSLLVGLRTGFDVNVLLENGVLPVIGRTGTIYVPVAP